MTGCLFLVLPALQKESFSFESFIQDKFHKLSATLFVRLFCIFFVEICVVHVDLCN